MTKKYTGKLLFNIFLLPLTVLFFGTCGLEDYPIINPVRQANITTELNNRAIVRIPTNNSGTSFTHFIIFYRIYVSNRSEPSPGSVNFSTINTVLASDYNYIRPYIDSDTLINTNMDSLFSGRGYKYLFFENGDINDVLSASPPSVLGNTLIFDFTSGKNPTMTMGSNVYTLYRSNGNGTYNPRTDWPDYYFVNKNDLWNTDYINSNTNADVVNMSGLTNSSPLHFTYAALFIVAAGINPNTYSYIYSTPSLIHVFELPAQW